VDKVDYSYAENSNLPVTMIMVGEMGADLVLNSS